MLTMSEKYRSKALACEKIVKSAPDTATKEAWAEIAMEWHSLAAKAAVDFNDIEVK